MSFSFSFSKFPPVCFSSGEFFRVVFIEAILIFNVRRFASISVMAFVISFILFFSFCYKYGVLLYNLFFLTLVTDINIRKMIL